MISQCLISFGSNLGRRDSVIADAARRIAEIDGVGPLHASRLFETPPIGGPGGQERFLNAVAAFDTTLSARQLLRVLQETELDLGRERRDRWGARSIDLDVVLHGALVGGGTGLIVPHPRYTARQFVLQPACDVAAHYRDPRFGWTLQRLTSHLSAGVPSLALVGGDDAVRRAICMRLQDEYGMRTYQAGPLADPMNVVGNVPAGRARAPQASDPASRAPATTRPPVTRRSDTTVEVKSALWVDPEDDQPWVSAFVPRLPSLDSPETDRADVPRLLARLQQTAPANRWPAPHQIWPSGWQWPEYRLEIDDLDWAVREVASAIDSMRCPVVAVTEDDQWWR